jgi:hypothetical protein
VIYIKREVELGEGIELVNRVLTNIKKEGAKKLLGSSSLLLLLLLLLISKVLKASSKLLLISPLKLVINCLYPLLKRLLKLGALVLNQLRFLDLN